MTVRWSNIVAGALLVVAMVIMVTNWSQIVAFVGSIRMIGPSGTTEDQVMGLIALGLILVTLVALVRILCHRGGQP